MLQMLLKFFLVAAFSALLLAAPPTVPRKLDPSRLEAIEARMQTYVDRGSIAGAVTLVARKQPRREGSNKEEFE